MQKELISSFHFSPIFILYILVQMVQPAIGTKNNWLKFLESQSIAHFSGYMLIAFSGGSTYFGPVET
jgi:zinc transporter ZupT